MKEIICENIRKGYIGKKVYDDEGIEYVQVSRGKPKGYFVAKKVGDTVAFGFSSVDGRENSDGTYDKFDKKTGYDKAVEKLEAQNFEIPTKFMQQFKHFFNRAHSYFKVENSKVEKNERDILEQKCYEMIASTFRGKDEGNAKAKHLFEAMIHATAEKEIKPKKTKRK